MLPDSPLDNYLQLPRTDNLDLANLLPGSLGGLKQIVNQKA